VHARPSFVSRTPVRMHEVTEIDGKDAQTNAWRRHAARDRMTACFDPCWQFELLRLFDPPAESFASLRLPFYLGRDRRQTPIPPRLPKILDLRMIQNTKSRKR